MRVHQEQDYDTEVTPEMLAWADIKDAQKTNKILSAVAVGLELMEAGGEREECLKLRFNGVFGYLPKRKIDTYDFKSMQFFLGKEFDFVVDQVFINNDEQVGFFLADRIKALELSSKKFWKIAKTGLIIDAFIRGIDQYNLYLLVEGVPVMMNRTDVGHSFYDDLRQEFEIGEYISVKIISLEKPSEDKEGKLEVSAKVLASDPWVKITNYHERSTYLGTITKVHAVHGLFIELEKGLSVRTNFPPGAMSRVFKNGDDINVKIVSIDAVGRRIKALAIIPNKKIGQKSSISRPITGRTTRR